MTLPLTGPISANQINTELKKLANSSLNFSDNDFKYLAEIASGSISMSDFRGKAANPYTLLSQSNFYTPHIINGINAVGEGPSGDPGTVSFNGQSFRTSYWLGLNNYLADTGNQYTTSRDMVFVNSSFPKIRLSQMTNTFGININDVRAISSPVTVGIVLDVDDRFYTGYWKVSLSNPPTWNDLATGSWIYGTETFQPSANRQRNISLSWTMPVPENSEMFIISALDNLGVNNVRYTIS
jgi:hypothetical protein